MLCWGLVFGLLTATVIAHIDGRACAPSAPARRAYCALLAGPDTAHGKSAPRRTPAATNMAPCRARNQAHAAARCRAPVTRPGLRSSLPHHSRAPRCDSTLKGWGSVGTCDRSTTARADRGRLGDSALRPRGCSLLPPRRRAQRRRSGGSACSSPCSPSSLLPRPLRAVNRPPPAASVPACARELPIAKRRYRF